MKIEQYLNLGFALAIVGLIVVGFFVQRGLDNIRTISDRRAEARQAAFKLQYYISLITDAETGQRGYLITGDEDYLQPYNNAIELIHKEGQILANMLALDPVQKGRFTRVQDLSEKKLKELALTIEIRRKNGLGAAQKIVLTHTGHEAMREIRAIDKDLEKRQLDIIDELNIQMNKIIDRSSLVVHLGSLIAVLLTVVISILLSRSRKQRVNVEQSLHKSNLGLEAHKAQLSNVVSVQNIIATSPLNTKNLMELIVHHSQKLTQSDGAVIELLEGDEFVYHWGCGKGLSFLGFRINREGSFSGLCLQQDQLLICQDSEVDERVNRDACRKVDLRSMVVVPLRHGNKTIGVLKNFSAKPQHFTEDYCNALHLITGVLSSALGQATAFDEKTELIKDLEKTKLELTSAKDLAESGTEAKSRFLASMSHEFRTPLNGILGMTSLLMEEALTSEQKEYGNAIKSSGESLLRLVNDALDLSKIEAGKLEFEKLDFDLESTMLDLKKSFSYTARQKNIALDMDILTPLPLYLCGDPGRLRQILTNLISNAIKFTPEGSVRVRVQSLVQNASEVQLRFEVEDTGIGIPDAAVKNLFQEFVQADSSTTRLYGGTGLGLFICKKLVHLMDGEIGVTSSPSQGSTFWFTVKMSLGQKIEADFTPLALFENHPIRLRVLIAEDNPVNQAIIAKMLERMGVTCNVVTNGREAVDALKTLPYDLVLMDCNMPEMDGYEATGFIRSSNLVLDSRIPIIAMTANALKGDAERCLSAGMDDYVPKPLNMNRVREVLVKWDLAIHEAERAAA